MQHMSRNLSRAVRHSINNIHQSYLLFTMQRGKHTESNNQYFQHIICSPYFNILFSVIWLKLNDITEFEYHRSKKIILSLLIKKFPQFGKDDIKQPTCIMNLTNQYTTENNMYIDRAKIYLTKIFWRSFIGIVHSEKTKI